MGSKSRKLWEQKSAVDKVFELINEHEELEKVAEDTDVAYLMEFQDEAMEYIKNKGKYSGISTGFPTIDNRIGSFLPGELFVIAGDTGHGKSLLAMNIAQNAYKQTQKPVLMVNLELTRNQAVERFYHLSGDEHDYAGIMIQRAPAVSYRDIDTLMKKAKDQGACLVIIDHLHFFSRSADNATQEISRIMKHFKECAVENELPVILLSHVTPTRIMNPDGSTKKVYKPGLHNLKGSSSIEQDADMVGFIFRDDNGDIEFYTRKNRSRPNIQDPVKLTQTDWKLEEWQEPISVPHGW